MVDPWKITRFKRDDKELHEFFVFSICVAGKTAGTIAPAVERLYRSLDNNMTREPFLKVLKRYSQGAICDALKRMGIGCYNIKSAGLYAAAQQDLNLRTCTVEDLEALPGIGPKTARFFLLHSRPRQQLAALDTHILKYLGSLGYRVPKTTPQSSRMYGALETIFLALAKEAKMSPSAFDLYIWKQYAKAPRVCQ